MAHMLRVYVNSKIPKGKKQVTIGSMCLYSDLVEGAREAEGTADLQSHLASLGAKSG